LGNFDKDGGRLGLELTLDARRAAIEPQRA